MGLVEYISPKTVCQSKRNFCVRLTFRCSSYLKNQALIEKTIQTKSPVLQKFNKIFKRNIPTKKSNIDIAPKTILITKKVL